MAFLMLPYFPDAAVGGEPVGNSISESTYSHSTTDNTFQDEHTTAQCVPKPEFDEEWDFSGSQEESRQSGSYQLEKVDLTVQTNVVVSQVVLCLLRRNEPPCLFNYNGQMISLDDSPETGWVKFDKKRLKRELIMGFDWVRGNRVAKPGSDVVELIYEELLDRLPKVHLLTTVPTVTAGGELISERGFHPESKCLYLPNGGDNIPSIPNAPSAEDVQQCVHFLTSQLFGDFLFVNEADRAHAIGALLTPFVRPLLKEGLTPAQLVLANFPGSGKTTLCNLISIIVTGTEAQVMAPGSSDEEMRKRITAALLTGRKIFLLDNLPSKRALDSASLATLLTSHVWNDRVIGSSNMATIQNDLMLMMTGNNPSLSPELLRRTVPIHLTGKANWRKRSYTKSDILSWCKDHRMEIISACLTIIQSWLNAGRPAFSGKSLPSYGNWCEIIGGVLEHAGVSGFLEGLDSFYNASNSQDADLEQFYLAWWTAHGAKEIRCSDLVALCGKKLLKEELGNSTDRSKQTRLARFLQEKVGEFDQTWVLEVVRKEPSNLYRLHKLEVVLHDESVPENPDDVAETQQAA